MREWLEAPLSGRLVLHAELRLTLFSMDLIEDLALFVPIGYRIFI